MKTKENTTKNRVKVKNINRFKRKIQNRQPMTDMEKKRKKELD